MENFPISEIIEGFAFQGDFCDAKPYGNGHINDTYLVSCRQGQGVQRYILQRMNDAIFRDPPALMENIANVTSFLREEVLRQGGDPLRETLNIVPARDSRSYCRDSQGHYWRAYLFIENALCLEAVQRPEDFFESAVAFGRFQKLLARFPAHTLHETIPDFHNTRKRFEALEHAIRQDACGRVSQVQEEIQFAMARKEEAGVCVALQESGQLPLRVTHNDTKLNNVMLDAATRKGLCVIDLDTVMPGLAINDFGDSIRFGASTAPEDEQDLDRVWMDLTLYETYVRGFLAACGDSLTPKELEMLPMGAKLMTFECGIRFLTDYLQGDTYFKTHRPGQNLDRCRTQFKLVADMEEKWERMAEIVKQHSK